jgi:O-Antigen ligase
MSAFPKALLPQRHPDLTLQFAWNWVQVGILLAPLSALLGGLGVVVGAIAVWRNRYPQIVQRRVNWGFAALSGLMILSAVLAYLPVDAGLGLFNFLPYFLIFAGFSELFQTPEQLRQVVRLIVLSSIPVVVIGFAQMLAGWLGLRQVLHVQILWIVVDWAIDLNGTPPGRMSSVLAYANVLANYLVMTFVLGIGLWVEEIRQRAAGSGQKSREEGKREQTIGKTGREREESSAEDEGRRLDSVQRSAFSVQRSAGSRLLPSAFCLLPLSNAIALILTNSRNAWAIAAGAGLCFALYLGWRWLVIGVGMLTGIVLGSAFSPSPLREGLRTVVPAFFWARLTDQLYPNRPVPTLRTTQWQFAWSLMQQRPWLGWGLRNFRPLYQAEMHFNLGHPHNLPLMLLCETGIPATVLFLGLVGWVVMQGVRRLGQMPDTSDRLLLFTMLLAFLSTTIFGLFDVTLFDGRVNLLGWLLLAGIMGKTHNHFLLPHSAPHR